MLHVAKQADFCFRQKVLMHPLFMRLLSHELSCPDAGCFSCARACMHNMPVGRSALIGYRAAEQGWDGREGRRGIGLGLGASVPLSWERDQTTARPPSRAAQYRVRTAGLSQSITPKVAMINGVCVYLGCHARTYPKVPTERVVDTVALSPSRAVHVAWVFRLADSKAAGLPKLIIVTGGSSGPVRAMDREQVIHTYQTLLDEMV